MQFVVQYDILIYNIYANYIKMIYSACCTLYIVHCTIYNLRYIKIKYVGIPCMVQMCKLYTIVCILVCIIQHAFYTCMHFTCMYSTCIVHVYMYYKYYKDSERALLPSGIIRILQRYHLATYYVHSVQCIYIGEGPLHYLCTVYDEQCTTYMCVYAICVSHATHTYTRVGRYTHTHTFTHRHTYTH